MITHMDFGPLLPRLLPLSLPLPFFGLHYLLKQEQQGLPWRPSGEDRRGPGSIPGQGAKIPQDLQCGQKTKKRKKEKKKIILTILQRRLGE